MAESTAAGGWEAAIVADEGQPGAPGAQGAPVELGRRRPGGRVTGLLAAMAVCLALTGLAGARLTTELTRPPTRAELDRAAALEVARRWRTWPAGRIFPAAIGYEPDLGGSESARRVAVGPDIRCAGGLDTALAAVAAAHGCAALLRAAYLDQPQGVLVTVGVLVLPDANAARQVLARLPKDGAPSPGVRALTLPGSVTARSGDGARQESASGQRGPYVVMATAGYADGRPAGSGPKQRDLSSLPPQLVDAVLDPLSAPSRPVCPSRPSRDPEVWSC